jgi:hypothetical protein
MRPRLVACLVALTAVAAGFEAASGVAADKTPGDGCLVVQNGFGLVTVTVTRGVAIGRVGAGAITVEDTAVDDGKAPKVKGAQTLRALTGGRIRYESDSTMRFRVSGGSKLTLNAQYVNLSFVGRGTAVLSAAGFEDVPGVDMNLFSYDAASFCEDNYQTLPGKPTRYSIQSTEQG